MYVVLIVIQISKEASQYGHIKFIIIKIKFFKNYLDLCN